MITDNVLILYLIEIYINFLYFWLLQTNLWCFFSGVWGFDI